VSSDIQKTMLERAGIKAVQVLQTRYSPQASQPELLATALIALKN
jgi:hypothetical protein